MKTFKRFIAFFCAIVFLSSIGAVYATWKYSSLPVPEQSTQFGVGIVDFYYKPEEILPGDDEATELHENHLNLIENIVNHIDYGLNANKKPIVREFLLDNHGVIYSNQNVSGGNLKHMLLDSSDVESLMFVVEYVSDTEFNAYTFSGREADYDNMDTYIPVYKTQILKENGKWVATRSFAGSAMVFRPGVVSVSINVKTWISN